MEHRPIVILDFGSQYTQLIARRIREQNVFSVVLPCTAKLEEIRSHNPFGIILSGGPCSVYDEDAPPADPEVLKLGVPVLGICYGMQLMAQDLGGRVERGLDRGALGLAHEPRDLGSAPADPHARSSARHPPSSRRAVRMKWWPPRSMGS